jgi:uncharacterized protein
MLRRIAIPVAMAIASIGAAGVASAGEYAPLNCGKASSPAERTVCSSYSLGQGEARVATLFSIATSLVAMGQRGDIQDAQRKWIASREACGKNVGCLTAAYDQRIHALDNVIAGIASRGPY